MKKETIASGKKLTIWIINLSILGLILTSLFPLISVPENDAVKEDLYFDYEMMKNSDSVEINSLATDVNRINLVFWAIIIVALISFLSITFLTFLARWYLSFLTIISTTILILTILVVIFQYSFMTTVGNIDFISLSSVFHTVNYVHIILLFSIILLLCSILYTLIIVLNLVKQLAASKSKKSQEKITKEKSGEMPLEPSIDKQTSPPLKSIKKKVEIEKWLKQEIQNIDKKTEQDLYVQEKEVVKPLEPTTEEQIDIKDEITTSEDKIQPGPFPSEKREVKAKESDESKASQSFEDALSSAIEKKQSELSKQEQIIPESEEMIEEVKEQKELPLSEKDIITTEIIVKCPQCKHIFATKKEGEATKIKCPKCGKEGVAQ